MPGHNDLTMMSAHCSAAKRTHSLKEAPVMDNLPRHFLPFLMLLVLGFPGCKKDEGR